MIEIGVGMKHTGNVHWNALADWYLLKNNRKCWESLCLLPVSWVVSPEEGATYAFFVGGARHPEYLDKTDEELRELVNTSLHTMLGYPKGTQADAIRIYRHSHAIPQYMTETDIRLRAIDTVEHYLSRFAHHW